MLYKVTLALNNKQQKEVAYMDDKTLKMLNPDVILDVEKVKTPKLPDSSDSWNYEDKVL